MHLSRVAAGPMRREISALAWQPHAPVKGVADFAGGTHAIPDAKFRQHALCALVGLAGPADANVFKSLRRQLALVLIEFAIGVDAEHSLRIPGDGEVSPIFRRDL